MKISTEKTDQQQVNLTIEVNDEDMESFSLDENNEVYQELITDIKSTNKNI